ncbi:MAG: hypothetical protein ACRD5L_08520 [Bryobacteraceae bacterium]
MGEFLVYALAIFGGYELLIRNGILGGCSKTPASQAGPSGGISASAIVQPTPPTLVKTPPVGRIPPIAPVGILWAQQ